MKSYDRKNKICIVHIQPIISAKAKKKFILTFLYNKYGKLPSLKDFLFNTP